MQSSGTKTYEELANERQRLLAMLDSLTYPVFALDNDGVIYLHNAAALKLLGARKSVIGELFSERLHLTDTHGAAVDVFELAKTLSAPAERTDLCFRRAGKPDVDLDVTLSPIHAIETDHKRWGGYLVACRDISKEHDAEEEKDEFIAVTSHELRTPLAIAEASLSTALVPGLTKMNQAASDMVRQAHDNVLFLIDLVKDLTALSRAEKGVEDGQFSCFSLEDLMSEMVRDYQRHATDKSLRITASAKGHRYDIFTNHAELQEIIQNLVINAIKYSDHGVIQLDTSYEPKVVKITVRDNGIGIRHEDQDMIFTKFYRSSDSRVQSQSGTGLGLYISRKLAEHMGISLDFVSEPGKGSAFTLAIPRVDRPAKH